MLSALVRMRHLSKNTRPSKHGHGHLELHRTCVPAVLNRYVPAARNSPVVASIVTP